MYTVASAGFLRMLRAMLGSQVNGTLKQLYTVYA